MAARWPTPRSDWRPGNLAYLALVAGAVAPGISKLVRLIGARGVDRLVGFVMTTMLLGVAVSLTAGSPRFLLACGARVCIRPATFSRMRRQSTWACGAFGVR
jgi:hypothetical protein